MPVLMTAGQSFCMLDFLSDVFVPDRRDARQLAHALGIVVILA